MFAQDSIEETKSEEGAGETKKTFLYGFISSFLAGFLLYYLLKRKQDGLLIS
jgi:hypothetical protein